MNEYRRTIVHDPSTPYYYVEMGILDHLNGPASYPFPTEQAAILFAVAHKKRDPHRDIAVRYPDGRTRQINL